MEIHVRRLTVLLFAVALGWPSLALAQRVPEIPQRKRVRVSLRQEHRIGGRTVKRTRFEIIDRPIAAQIERRKPVYTGSQRQCQSKHDARAESPNTSVVHHIKNLIHPYP